MILTGAGLSAESGISTFRDPDGIWAKYDYRDVATPEGFARDPAQVHAFYNMRRRAHRDAKPNAAHAALARLQSEYCGAVTIITQNVDWLHEAAGAVDVIHMHGEALKALCGCCGARQVWHEDLSCETPCPSCRQKGALRPDVVWFGEMPYRLDEIAERLSQAEMFISIGTSGNVYPAAQFVAEAYASGAWTVELNLEPTAGAPYFRETCHGPATEVVPAYVDLLLRNGRER